MVSCFNVSVIRVSHPVYIDVNRIGCDIKTEFMHSSDNLKVNTSSTSGELLVSVENKCSDIEAETDDIEEHLKISFALICMVNKERILEVHPQQIFLLISNNYTEDVDVISNVDWKVLI